MNHILLKFKNTMNKLQTYIFLSLILADSLFSSENTLQFEIVPHDYSNESIKEQICAMFRDDKEIQKATFETEETIKKFLSEEDAVKKWSVIVCRSINDSSIIYGYMDYMYCDKVHFFAHPVTCC